MSILPTSAEENLKGVIRRVHGIGPARRIEITLGAGQTEHVIEIDAQRSQQWRIGQQVGLRPEQYRLFPRST
jgi:NOL1/NOP2/fmu family ribosome biogenesis protein